MQLASISVLSQPPLAAMPHLSEKPHLGFATKKTAWNPGPNVCNFTVTLGLQVAVVENSVRKTYSARYYNPATGRFMSRDPLDGSAKDPASLHKYLYADGDPVNGWDPTGRAAAFGYVVRVAKFLLKVPTLTEFSIELTACLVAVAAAIEDVATHGDVGPVGLGAVLFPCFPLETHSVAYVVFLVTGFAL